MVCVRAMLQFYIFFFNDTAPTEIYTLPLHDALPIGRRGPALPAGRGGVARGRGGRRGGRRRLRRDSSRLRRPPRSEEHTSELQSRQYIVCRLLLEKKKKTHTISNSQ